MEVSHRAGVSLGEPLIETVGMRGRPRMGDPASEEPELARTRLDRLAETHGHPVATRVPDPGSSSVMMSRAPLP